MWAWQRKMCFGQLQLNWIDHKWAFLQTVLEFDETSFFGTVSSKHSYIYFSGIFRISLWPRKIEMCVQIKYWMFYILIWRKTAWNSRMGLRNISYCVRNGGKTLGTTIIGFELVFIKIRGYFRIFKIYK